MVKVKKTIYHIIIALFISFILFLIYQIIRKILGGSWGFEQIAIGLLLANLGYAFYINSNLQRHLGRHEVTDRQFASLAKDFRRHKRTMETRFNTLETRFDTLEDKFMDRIRLLEKNINSAINI